MAEPVVVVPAEQVLVVVQPQDVKLLARALARGMRAVEVEDGLRAPRGAVEVLAGLERAARVVRVQSDPVSETVRPERLCVECGQPSSDGALRHGRCNRCRMRVRRAAEREARRAPWERMEAELAELERESEAARLAAEQSRLRWGL